MFWANVGLGAGVMIATIAIAVLYGNLWWQPVLARQVDLAWALRLIGAISGKIDAPVGLNRT